MRCRLGVLKRKHTCNRTYLRPGNKMSRAFLPPGNSASGATSKSKTSPASLAAKVEFLKRSGYNFPDTRWAAYRNEDLGHRDCGDLKFLAVGPQNTYKVTPERLPDIPDAINWRFVFVGYLDLQTGAIVDHKSRKHE